MWAATGTNRQVKPLPDRSYFLVIGAPRSGTTLLATMIGCHTDVGILNEDVKRKWIRGNLGKKVLGNKLCVPNQIQMKRRNIFALRWFKKLGFIAESPRSENSIEDYMEIPNLRVIAIVRDGNDAISSMMSRGKSSLETASYRWSQAIETIYELTIRYAQRVLVISFEDVVLHPETTMRKICQFLGLSFQRGMLDGYQYNPRYQETKLNEERVLRHKREQVDFRLALKSPSAYRKYQALLTQAQ